MSEWAYYSFYFGNGGSPSSAEWRINRETGEKQWKWYLMVGRESIEAVRAEYEKMDPTRFIEPELRTWGANKIYYGMNAWYVFSSPEEAEAQWERDRKSGWSSDPDDAQPEEIYWYEPGVPLY